MNVNQYVMATDESNGNPNAAVGGTCIEDDDDEL